MNLNKLQKLLDTQEIPRIKKQPKTFLGITLFHRNALRAFGKAIV
jgi:hypothetical protein